MIPRNLRDCVPALKKILQIPFNFYW